MLEEQFYLRIILIALLGIFYVITMKKMAQYKPKDQNQPTHIAMRVIGCFFFVLGAINALVAIYAMATLEHPIGMMGRFSVNGIVRSPGTILVWGFPTFEQQQAILAFSGAIGSLALGFYFFYFKKSASPWWKKILKFLGGVFLYGLFVNASEFHYFDAYEWIWFILFIAMVALVHKKSNKALKEENDVAETVPIAENTEVRQSVMELVPSEPIGHNQDNDHTRFMPPSESENTEAAQGSEVQKIVTTEAIDLGAATQDSALIVSEETSTLSSPKFCRNCGKLVDYESGAYCKYCGQEIK